MWLTKREVAYLQQQRQEALELYWRESAENQSLRIDIENLQRKVAQLQQVITYQQGGRVR